MVLKNQNRKIFAVILALVLIGLFGWLANYHGWLTDYKGEYAYSCYQSEPRKVTCQENPRKGFCRYSYDLAGKNASDGIDLNSRNPEPGCALIYSYETYYFDKSGNYLGAQKDPMRFIGY